MTPNCDPQAAADFLRALAHPMRLQILCRLLNGELSVGGFESELGLKQPNLSQQLAHLRDAQLVTTRREAKSIFYSLADDRVGVLLEALRVIQSRSFAQPAPKPAPTVATRLSKRPQKSPAAPPPTETAGSGRFAVVGWDLLASGGARR